MISLKMLQTAWQLCKHKVRNIIYNENKSNFKMKPLDQDCGLLKETVQDY